MSESLANYKLFFCWFYILVNTLEASIAEQKDARAVRSHLYRGNCSANEFVCRSGECIATDQVCDGVKECSNGADETRQLCLSKVCPVFLFKCDYGACIIRSARCDGVNDCADGSDEELCESALMSAPTPQDSALHCSANEFECQSGECLGIDQVCDGKQECNNGADETKELCSSKMCPAFLFKCEYGACVFGSARCDGVKDCADGSDEYDELCNQPLTPASTTQVPVRDVVTPPRPSMVTDRISTPEPNLRSCSAIFDDPNILVVHAYNTSVIVNYGEIIDEFREIFYRCKRTYVLYGSKDNHCVNGRWRYPIPKCSKVCSPGIINGVTFSSKCKFDHSETSCTGLIRPNTRADISCSVGYRKQYHDVPDAIQCGETGEWDYRPASCLPVCGKLPVSATPFVNGGEPVNITEVPWHTAIYKSVGGGNYDHICGGTIYSAKLVISAAHCFWEARRDETADKGLFTVAVGKVYRSYNALEPFLTQFFNLSEIHIPYSYGGAGRSYENDIAMLVLTNHIVYKDHIKPICIRWFNYAEREVKPGTVGRIAGWGNININNEFGEDLKAVDLPAFSKEQCLKDNLTYNNFITGEKFCVGAPDDESVCNGDSGGGYVVKNDDTETYYLWGVLSVGLGRTCDRNHLTTFTNIQYHKDMITEYELRYRPK